MENNIKYIFLRHGKLDLPYKDHSEMPLSVLIQIANGKISPSIDVNFLNEKLLKLEPFFRNIDRIVVSSLKRGIETGDIIKKFIEKKTNKKIDFHIEDNFKEVSFDVEKIISGLDYAPNLSQLNSLVFQAICSLREGSENSNAVFSRVTDMIKKYNTDSRIILVITHSFLLETLEMYINNRSIENFKGSYEELLKSPKINYLSGFTTDKYLNIIDFISV
jgi:hypothetical protein